MLNTLTKAAHGILQARTLELVAFPFSRDLPNPGIEPKVAIFGVLFKQGQITELQTFMSLYLYIPEQRMFLRHKNYKCTYYILHLITFVPSVQYPFKQ